MELTKQQKIIIVSFLSLIIVGLLVYLFVFRNDDDDDDDNSGGCQSPKVTCPDGSCAEPEDCPAPVPDDVFRRNCYHKGGIPDNDKCYKYSCDSDSMLQKVGGGKKKCVSRKDTYKRNVKKAGCYGHIGDTCTAGWKPCYRDKPDAHKQSGHDKYCAPSCKVGYSGGYGGDGEGGYFTFNLHGKVVSLDEWKTCRYVSDPIKTEIQSI